MTRYLSLAVLLTITTLATPPAHAADISVPETYPTLTSALLTAKAGDVINLGPGVYNEVDLVVPAGVTLAGTGDTPNQVVLDARGLGRILLCEGVEQTTIRNVTFMNGRASGPSSYDQSGGAIHCNNSNLSIIDCNFILNEADSHGGAIRCTNASPLISNCLFMGNSASAGGGGAIDCSYNSSPLVENCTFRDNSAQWGGALSCRDNSSPAISGGSFDGNSAANGPALGGAVFADYQAKPTFSLVTFSDNSAVQGGAAACLADSEINLDHCTVSGNESDQSGGGLYLLDAKPNITASLITFNTGQGIATAGTAAPVISCTDIHGNTSGDWVGAIADLAGTSNNLAVDPLYCTQLPLEDLRFHLGVNSPVVQTDCGVLGANPAVCSLTDIEAPPTPKPGIGQVGAWPNPFNPRTVVNFELEMAQRVRVKIFNLQGGLVRTLADQEFDRGPQAIAWNGDDDSGRRLGSGTYILLVEGRVDRQTQKLTLIK